MPARAQGYERQVSEVAHFDDLAGVVKDDLVQIPPPAADSGVAAIVTGEELVGDTPEDQRVRGTESGKSEGRGLLTVRDPQHPLVRSIRGVPVDRREQRCDHPPHVRCGVVRRQLDLLNRAITNHAK